MTIISLLGLSSQAVFTPAVEAYLETKRWLQERAAVSGGVFQNHKDQTDKLFACFSELNMKDAETLALCKTYAEERLFWLEWEVYGESGTPDAQHKTRCGFISNLRAGRPTVMFEVRP